MAKEPCFTYDDQALFATAPANIITGDEKITKYLTATLNSKLLYLAMRRFYMGGGIEGELKTNNLLKLPIPQITESNQPIADKIITLAEEILKTKEQDPKANTSAQEREIDNLVYTLYSLTPEEITIIEGK